MCDDWRYSFENFYKDMGERPAGYSIERMDVNRGYEPSNCIWADKTTQARNTRANVATMDMAREIRAKRSSGSSIKKLSQEFGMSRGNISQIVSHATWKEGDDAL